MSEVWRKSHERCVVTGEDGNVEMVLQVAPVIRCGYNVFTEVHRRMCLAAAAPEMLEALEMIIEDFKKSEFSNPEELEWWYTAIAAIAKAKGEQE